MNKISRYLVTIITEEREYYDIVYAKDKEEALKIYWSKYYSDITIKEGKNSFEVEVEKLEDLGTDDIISKLNEEDKELTDDITAPETQEVSNDIIVKAITDTINENLKQEGKEDFKVEVKKMRDLSISDQIDIIRSLLGYDM